MGLDNIAYKRVPVKFPEPTETCKGMLSGGDNWIRGKYYDDLCQSVTEHTMYEDMAESTVVEVAKELQTFARQMKEALSLMDAGHPCPENDYNFEETLHHDGSDMDHEWVYKVSEDRAYTYDDVLQLAFWFKTVADEEGHIVAWY
jgi:hypothetical protein